MSLIERVAGSAVLLDTCAIIFFAGGLPMLPDAVERLDDARVEESILVSPISAWEIGLLDKKGRSPRLRFEPTAADWFAKVVSARGIRAAPFDFEIGLAASTLPGRFHNDPADRLLVATARHLKVPIVTRDRLILDYAAAGSVHAVPC